MIEESLRATLRTALEMVAAELGLEGDLPTPELLAPKQKEHGDFATNLALVVAGRAQRPPREVAQMIVRALPLTPIIERAEVAGPGFINLFVTDDWLHDTLRR
ncbi:MAG: arginine--tRNA ligase, partial [Dehalococcoidia bacterium]